jgi:hypothetical protein
MILNYARLHGPLEHQNGGVMIAAYAHNCDMRNRLIAMERHPLPFVLTRMISDPL